MRNPCPDAFGYPSRKNTPLNLNTVELDMIGKKDNDELAVQRYKHSNIIFLCDISKLDSL